MSVEELFSNATFGGSFVAHASFVPTGIPGVEEEEDSWVTPEDRRRLMMEAVDIVRKQLHEEDLAAGVQLAITSAEHEFVEVTGAMKTLTNVQVSDLESVMHTLDASYDKVEQLQDSFEDVARLMNEARGNRRRGNGDDDDDDVASPRSDDDIPESEDETRILDGDFEWLQRLQIARSNADVVISWAERFLNFQHLSAELATDIENGKVESVYKIVCQLQANRVQVRKNPRRPNQLVFQNFFELVDGISMSLVEKTLEIVERTLEVALKEAQEAPEATELKFMLQQSNTVVRREMEHFDLQYREDRDLFENPLAAELVYAAVRKGVDAYWVDVVMDGIGDGLSDVAKTLERMSSVVNVFNVVNVLVPEYYPTTLPADFLAEGMVSSSGAPALYDTMSDDEQQIGSGMTLDIHCCIMQAFHEKLLHMLSKIAHENSGCSSHEMIEGMTWLQKYERVLHENDFGKGVELSMIPPVLERLLGRAVSGMGEYITDLAKKCAISVTRTGLQTSSEGKLYTHGPSDLFNILTQALGGLSLNSEVAVVKQLGVAVCDAINAYITTLKDLASLAYWEQKETQREESVWQEERFGSLCAYANDMDRMDSHVTLMMNKFDKVISDEAKEMFEDVLESLPKAAKYFSSEVYHYFDSVVSPAWEEVFVLPGWSDNDPLGVIYSTFDDFLNSCNAALADEWCDYVLRRLVRQQTRKYFETFVKVSLNLEKAKLWNATEVAGLVQRDVVRFKAFCAKQTSTDLTSTVTHCERAMEVLEQMFRVVDAAGFSTLFSHRMAEDFADCSTVVVKAVYEKRSDVDKHHCNEILKTFHQRTEYQDRKDDVPTRGWSRGASALGGIEPPEIEKTGFFSAFGRKKKKEKKKEKKEKKEIPKIELKGSPGPEVGSAARHEDPSVEVTTLDALGI